MKLTLFFLSLFYSLSFAQVYMNINNKDGTTQTFNINEVRKLTFSGIVGVEESKKITSVLNSFNLLQNYPNPFNPSTTIEYQIQQTGNIEIKIFNITGQLVRTVEKSSKDAGTYRVKWDGKNDFNQNVSSGIYLLRVNFNSSYLTKKIILLK